MLTKKQAVFGRRTFDYTVEQWAEITRSIQHFEAKQERIEKACLQLKQAARSFLWEFVNKRRRKQQENLRLKHWTRAGKLADSLMSEFTWLSRNESHPPDPSGKEHKLYTKELDALMTISVMAKKHTTKLSDDIFDGYPKTTAKAASPMRSDISDVLAASWLPNRPNTDTALMLGMAHTLYTEKLHDRDFLSHCCVGFDIFARYLTGESDGIAKSAEWAASICEIEAGVIRDLARRASRCRTMIALAYSLQRGDHGEQPIWMGITLAAMLGQIGLPGGGFGVGYGSMGTKGMRRAPAALRSIPTGNNPTDRFIPVSRIADMLLSPGEAYDFNGKRYTYPDIHMLLWGGGNPFHHHQDINKLLRAWQKPDTVVVQEIFWTPVARHADIVLPTCSTLERDDIGAGWWDNVVYAMKQAIPPLGESRSDYAIVAALAERLGYGTAFTEGRDEIGWARFLYQQLTERLAEQQIRLPDFDRFWQDGRIVLPETPPFVLFEDFRRDPKANPLQTPSGKIEIFSSTIAGFGYADCPGHPTWLEPLEWLGSAQAQHHPLHLISNQPANRLHSQLDPSTLSIAQKIHGREPLWINPADAARRGIGEGDVVLVRNVRGSCLAGAHITDAIRLGVVQLATGAWYDPEEPGRIGTLDKHGNPNVLTFDKGTSKLAQGPSAHSVLVEVKRWDGPVPAVTAHQPPAIIDRDSPKGPATLAKM